MKKHVRILLGLFVLALAVGYIGQLREISRLEAALAAHRKDQGAPSVANHEPAASDEGETL